MKTNFSKSPIKLRRGGGGGGGAVKRVRSGHGQIGLNQYYLELTKSEKPQSEVIGVCVVWWWENAFPLWGN